MIFMFYLIQDIKNFIRIHDCNLIKYTLTNIFIR